LFILLLPLLLFHRVERCVAQSYTLEVDSAPYKELTGGVPVPIGYGFDVYYIELPNERFDFFGHSYELQGSGALQVTGSGNLRIDDEVAGIATIIDGLFTTLDTLDERSSISYMVEGEPGERVVAVQWKAAGFGKGTSADSANVQVWLYQKSGIVEMRYGPGAISTSTLLASGIWVGAFAAPLDFTKAIAKCWITGSPAHPTFDTATNLDFKILSGLPTEGVVYRLRPGTTSGVDDGGRRKSGLLLRPNPATDIVEIVADEMGPSPTVFVDDLLGREVVRAALTDSRTLDTSGLPGGVYLVRIVDDRTVRRATLVKR